MLKLNVAVHKFSVMCLRCYWYISKDIARKKCVVDFVIYTVDIVPYGLRPCQALVLVAFFSSFSFLMYKWKSKKEKSKNKDSNH